MVGFAAAGFARGIANRASRREAVTTAPGAGLSAGTPQLSFQNVPTLSPFQTDAGGLRDNPERASFASTAPVAAPGAAPAAAPTVASPLDDRFARILGDVDALRASVAPGSSRILSAGLRAIQNQRSVGVGTVRENLARRGVLGSSFGGNQVTAANAEFDQIENEFRANVQRDELNLTQQILQFEAQVRADELNRELTELDIDNRFQLGLQSIAATNTQLQLAAQRLEAESRAGIGALIGTFGGFALDRLFPPTVNVAGLF